ncbi:MAG: type II CAAX prenyl endopeptidase Rce1 family protein [Nitrososphaeraceae archaeon]
MILQVYNDIKPKNWLSKYQEKSILYLVIMFLFYHGIGIISLLIGTLIVQNVITDYEEPVIERSVIQVLAAGPIEETLFFGIPFYAFGSTILTLFGGIAWAMLHILGTNSLEVSQLNYANLFFVIPSLFFSLRTWITGKGWFAIIAHSVWNSIFFTLGCNSGEFPCSYYIKNEDISTIILSILLIGATYVLMVRRNNKIIK